MSGPRFILFGIVFGRSFDIGIKFPFDYFYVIEDVRFNDLYPNWYINFGIHKD
jgi:hypothetical protein